jgi:hypothetical protein
MRDELRLSMPSDEAIDAVLRDMMAKEAPANLKARVLARLGDEAIDRALGDLAAREVPASLKARVLTRLDEESIRADRARDERWTLVQPLLRPALGLAAAGLVVATALTAWLLRAPLVLAPENERTGQVGSQPEGSGGQAAPDAQPATRSKGATSDREPSPSPATASAVVTRGPRSATPTRATRLARHTTAWPGAESANGAGEAHDPLAIRQLRVDPLSVSRITIPPIEVTPVEIVPAMSDTTANPPGEPGAESRTGG